MGWRVYRHFRGLTMQRKNKQKILVLGAGNFGTCLAQHLALQGHEVCIWARAEEVVRSINEDRKNPKYLQSLYLSPTLKACGKLEPDFVKGFQCIVLAVPTQSLRDALKPLKDSVHLDQLLISAVKGIEIGTEKLPSHVVTELFGTVISHHMVSLSGPSFAVEVAEGQPTGVTVASAVNARADWAQDVFHAPTFRAYTSNDPIGIEIAGALKNVIAISVGACAGLGFQENSRATLMTRGLAEITRVGMAMGANPLTFKGLGGVGDLFLTCSSTKSRNYTVGYHLGKGKNLDSILAELGSVAEGVGTSLSAYKLASYLKVSAPITKAVYQVLHENHRIEKVVSQLMNRNMGPELT